MLVPAPASITRPISDRAVQIAKQTAPRSTLSKQHGADSFQSVYHTGEIGIQVPDEFFYMIIQNRGFKAFNMYALEGKTIPIRGPNGQISFRVAKNVGKRKITTRNESGQVVSSKIAWRHPGLKPKNFLEKACKQAIDEYKRQMDIKGVLETLQNTDIGPLVKVLAKQEKKK